jgi:tetratricopeptide (TPR) repeat protein
MVKASIPEALALGLKHHRAGNLKQARQIYRQVLRAQPRQFDALHMLGVLCHHAGKHDPAVNYISRALELNPDSAEAHYNLGHALQDQGNLEEAVQCYRRALRLKPDYAEAYFNLGNTFRDLGRFTEAVHCYRQATHFRPDYPKAYNNLGKVLLEQKKLDEAAAAFEHVLRLQPESSRAHANLGGVYLAQGRLDEAVARCREALRWGADNPEAHNNLGAALWDQGQVAEALASFEVAVSLKPAYARAHLNRALAWLKLGNFEQGWPEYAWRWRCKEFTPRHAGQPTWDGRPLEGRTILLEGEQGLGDTLQFIRYAPLVQERGGRVVVECQPALVPLLADFAGADGVVAHGGAVPRFDVHAPLLTLPALLGTTLATVPAQVPYLHADAQLTQWWRKELGTDASFKVGISWEWNPNNDQNHSRSFPLAHFEPLARLPGVRLISLQKGPGTEQLTELAGRFPVTDLGPRLDERAGAFMDTAAVMKNLDLVIAPDTAVAHLAGALAVPVWVPLARAAEWRWLTGREDSPWYPTMRLFRQAEAGNWAEVFERLTQALAEMLKAAPRAIPVRVPLAPAELIDKITALEVKSERTTDAEQLRRLLAELDVLAVARDRAIRGSEEVARLTADLKEVNQSLAQLTEDLRACESAGDCGTRFVELACAFYRTQERRNEVKRKLNELLGARSVE